MTLSVFYGTIIHSQSLTELEIIDNGLLVVDRSTGVIQRLERNVSNLEEALKDMDASTFTVSVFIDKSIQGTHYLLL